MVIHAVELLYADDLVLTADSKPEVEEIFNEMRSATELRGLKYTASEIKIFDIG